VNLENIGVIILILGNMYLILSFFKEKILIKEFDKGKELYFKDKDKIYVISKKRKWYKIGDKFYKGDILLQMNNPWSWEYQK